MEGIIKNSKLTLTSGNVTWDDTIVSGDSVRKTWYRIGQIVIASVEFIPLTGKIASGNVICSGLPTPKYGDIFVYGGNTQQMRIRKSGNLEWYFPTDTTTCNRTDITLTYVCE